MQFVQLMNELKKPEVHCSEGQWVEFSRSKLWQDLSRELNAWIINTYELLEDPDDELTPGMTGQLKGRIRTLKEVLNLPEQLIEAIRQEEGYDS